jgi:oligopeptide transport system substrate-binding protein
LIVYFYRLNVARKPLDDVRIRRALNMAIDKQEICDRVTKAGQRPARSLVPPGLTGYSVAETDAYDPEGAKRLLEDAGYPGGRDLPKIQILYNTNEGHRDIAEVIQQYWRRIGIDAELRNLEWGVYLDAVNKIDFDVARAGWIPDYSDPNTYLSLFVTNGPQNSTNWSNPEYDSLIAAAGKEPDIKSRMDLLRLAEVILMREQPIIPIYFYVSINMVNERVEGFSPNVQDMHQLHILRVKDRKAR